jgi:hypothetical protein
MKAPHAKTAELVPAGNHMARLYKITYIGTVPTEYQGVKSDKPQVDLTFELCDERKVLKEGEEPKPLVISTMPLTFSMGERARLRPIIEGIVGTALDDDEAYNMDIDDLLGEACLLHIVHTDKGYAQIKSTSPLLKGMTAPALFNPKTILNVATMTLQEINALPNFIKERMISSAEYRARFVMDEDNDDIT